MGLDRARWGEIGQDECKIYNFNKNLKNLQ